MHSTYTDTLHTTQTGAEAAHISIETPAPRPLSSSPLSPHRKSPMPPCSSSTSAPPAEIEATLTRLSSHQGVLGCLVLSRHDGLVIRSGGQMFEPSGPGAKQRAEMLKSVTRLVKSSVESLASDIRAIDETVSFSLCFAFEEDGMLTARKQDELGFMRVRTKKYEIMITPNDKYLLVVLQVCLRSCLPISRGLS